MKRFAYYIACCSLVALFSCTHDDVDGSLVSAGDGKITIQSTLDDMIITRADDKKQERKITHIDVFAVDKNGDIVYYERDKTGNNSDDDQGKGKLTLGVARQAKKANGSFYFAQGEEYSFVLVANAVANEDKMRAITSLDALELAVQDDSFETDFGEAEGSSSVDPSMSRQTLLHLTGTKQGENEDHPIPQVFLMDAVATDSKDNTKWVVNSTSDKGNLNLSAEFKRAASKIIVNITQGVDVEFHTKLDEENTQYDFYKLPASTFVLPNQSKLVGVQLINTAPMGPNDETFIWEADGAAQNNIQVIGYAYSHSWSDVDLANETSLILNIPMKWNKDNDKDHTKEEDAPRSWYKVPLSQGKKFDRNMCYIVNVKINAVGAQSRSTAIKLVDIEYVTRDWVDVPISVGNSEERPKYLILNTDLVEMYNVNFDNTSLSFSSSSAITSVELKDVYSQNTDGTFTSATDNYYAYYINKFGVKTQLNEDIRSTISATAEENVLDGAISILSPIVPATPAEINKQILEQLGPAPTAPTLAQPTYNGTIVPEPPFVAEPKPQDYVNETSYSPSNLNSYNISWTEEETTGGLRNYWVKRSCTQTVTEYKYSLDDNGNPTFYKRTGTRKVTQTRNDYWDDITTTYGDITYTPDWSTDTTTQKAWDTAWGNYQTYLTNKADYDAQQEEPDFQAYLAEKQDYDNAWAEYNDELADYNEQADAIREAAGGAETHYNTIRYLEFEVTNEQGMKATFRVMQYPIIYITHVMGYYSYRDDFNGTTWEKRGNPSNINNCNWSSGKWTYSHLTSDNNAGIFRSKVYNPNGNNTGTYPIDYYYWGSNGRNFYNAGSLSNPRMYHVRVTATSGTYVVGRPRFIDENGNPTSNVENGYTEDSAENAKLVSPSFMLASQLGATQSPGTDDDDMPKAADHCRQYVEVAADGTEYHDWRLPTAAEIDIIIKLQNNSQAMDEVLSGVSYWSASGIKATGVSGASGTGRIRCVRDAY